MLEKKIWILQKKIWIPIVCVLVIAMVCGEFYGRKVANQAPIVIIKPTAVEKQPVAPKPPPPGETAESGHWHGDEWHAAPHEPALEVSEAPVETVIDEERAVYEASLSHFTAEERARYDRVLRGEIVRHREKYPACQDHEAVFEDADRHARWWVAYKKWWKEKEKLSAKWKKVMFENDELYENLRFNMSPEERRQFIENMSGAERASITTRVQTWKEREKAAFQTYDEFKKEEPIEPKRQHTH